MARLPVRGPGVHELGLPLPPQRMPVVKGGRPLKRWRWIGIFGPELMLCVGDARVAGVPRRWWAVAYPDGRIDEGKGRPAHIELDLDLSAGGDPVEVVSDSGRQWIWTRKQVVPVTARVGGRELSGDAFVDESAGYHERRTSWFWSAGLGRGEGGERVAWNLVAGVHDSPEASERTVWVDGRAHEAPLSDFAPDLSRVDGLEFREWSVREHHENLVLFRSDYRQPFGSFSGELPGGMRLAEGHGVMERHEALW